MKRLLTAALALTLLAGPAALAEPGRHDGQGGNDQGGNGQQGHDQQRNDQRGNGQRGGDHRGNDQQGRNQGGYDQQGNDQSRYAHARNDQRWAQHRWARGERLPSDYYRTRTYYVDYRSHHLRRPPYGYQWVRVDNNYALMALATGLISQLIYGR
ncbi:RcnB family protein [Phenylobacterium sp.]|uniref:RcnB family protein n=1 Tax=Phenylobacterium sp. TaxID=1871053 RepID=UPI00286D6687|nr:RcnB family protein [Phenylobacterium sp.]